MQEIFIEHNPSSSSLTETLESSQGKKTFYLNVENIDLKSLCSIRSLFDIDRPLNDYRLFNTKESVAHYKAHVDAWKYIVDNNIKAARIRDNTCSSSSSSSSSSSADVAMDLNKIPWMQGDLFLLDYDELPDLGKEEKEEEDEEEDKKKWYGLKNIFHGLNDYVITNQGARFLLRYAYPVEMRIDSFVGTLAHLYPSEFKVFYLDKGSGKDKEIENKKENGIKKKERKVVVHLRNNRLETPFLHNHPRHTRPSNPMSNIPMMILTFLFFGIFLLVIFLILVPSTSGSTSREAVTGGNDDE